MGNKEAKKITRIETLQAKIDKALEVFSKKTKVVKVNGKLTHKLPKDTFK